MTKRLNESFIQLLDELREVMAKKGEHFRAKAYQKAHEALICLDEDIDKDNFTELKTVSGIGPAIIEKFDEFVKTGTLQILEKEKANPVNILSDVYGIGPKKADELVRQGITTISELRKRQTECLNDTQRIGLAYYEDILKRIPRKEIETYEKVFASLLNKVQSMKFEVVGSYRRGAMDSGDIDVILTSKNSKDYRDFIDRLIENKIIVEVLSRGSMKCLVICRLGVQFTARRVDFLYTTEDEYPFSILYFTGSKIFNTVMRGRAVQLGYSLNEHGLTKGGEKVQCVFKTEKDIFDFLSMDYKLPHERVDGRCIKTKSRTRTMKKRHHGPGPGSESEPNQDIMFQFKTKGIGFLNTLSESQLTKMIKNANNDFHNGVKELFTDNEYDILKEYVSKRFPLNQVLKEIGAPIIVEKSKVVLPFEMGSMDKIKPDTDSLKRWKQKFKGPYLLSCKLDGVSGLIQYTKNQPIKIYTRGDGKVGQDISYFAPFIKTIPLPNDTLTNLVVRGEFIILKKVFKEKYSIEFANPRNLVAGTMNRVTIDPKVEDIHFVAYEVISPSLKPSDQFELLEKMGFIVAQHVLHQKIENDLLSDVLVEWRSEYEYEIDGVIVSSDMVYPRVSGNPEHAFAFKMVLTEQVAEAKVVDVLWSASKDGYLKPRVQIEPIMLGGVKIEYATGFNALFIKQHKIGVGAVIEIIRSGDVIPHICSIIVPCSTGGKMPDLTENEYMWSESGVDIILTDLESDSNVKEKVVAGFFKGICVDGLGPGNISRIMAAGFSSISDIIGMTKSDLLAIDGFKEKMAIKIVEGIRNGLDKASLVEIMSYSNIFGRGFNLKKIEMIMDSNFDILTSQDTVDVKLKKIAHVKGLSFKTAELFVGKIEEFKTFLVKCGLQDKLFSGKDSVTDIGSHPLFEKTVVMTGTREPIILNLLKKTGGKLGQTVNKNTFALIAKNTDDSTSKLTDAKNLGVPIYNCESFMKKYSEVDF
jgi:DNA ligase (NAD+)